MEEKNVFDDIFDLGSKSSTKKISSPIKEEVVEQVEQADKTDKTDKTDNALALAAEKTKEIPKIMGDEKVVNPDYLVLVERIVAQYKMLPQFDDSIWKEIGDLAITSNPTPTLSVINLELEKVQGAKDRLGEIFLDIIKSHTFKKRALDILRDSYGKFAQAKNAESRKGEAAYLVSDFEIDFAWVEALLKQCLHILKNLDSQHESLSRRISVYQIQAKMMDVGRGISPEYNFDKLEKLVGSSDEKLPPMFEDLSKDKDSSEKSSDDPG